MIDRDPIDVFERGQHLGPHRLWKDRTARPLVHICVGRHRDDQHRAFAACRLEMAHVAHVDEVEHAVRQHDGFAARSRPRGDLGELLDAGDLVARGARRALRLGRPERPHARRRAIGHDDDTIG
jgi:hypothetical protein